MTTDEIAVAMARLGAESLRDHVLGDPVLTPRLGFAAARRAGIVCFSSTKLDDEVFNHASGFGTFGDGTQHGIDAVLRHYDAIGGTPRFEVMLPGVSRHERALLARNGFREARLAFACHVRTTARPPRRRDVPTLTVARVRPAEAPRYARLATRGFGGRGTVAQVFERGWTRQLRHDPRVAAFMGLVGRRAVASGVLIRRPNIAGLYSGSVLAEFRGRGFQNAMIAARLAYGWSRGVRTFYSWTDPDSSSARNLRDEGFRTRFEVRIYERDAS